MPVYEYECPKCGRFEETRKMSDPKRQRCPKCRFKVEMVFSPTGIIFKGTGWYTTDYKGKSNRPQEKKIASVKQKGGGVYQPPGKRPRWAQG